MICIRVKNILKILNCRIYYDYKYKLFFNKKYLLFCLLLDICFVDVWNLKLWYVDSFFGKLLNILIYLIVFLSIRVILFIKCWLIW